MIINQLRQIREKLLLSKAELASKAGVSPQTISNIEKDSRAAERDIVNITYDAGRLFYIGGYHMVKQIRMCIRCSC
jgi:DNA-binding XRE family transcriptional regulator